MPRTPREFGATRRLVGDLLPQVVGRRLDPFEVATAGERLAPVEGRRGRVLELLDRPAALLRRGGPPTLPRGDRPNVRRSVLRDGGRRRGAVDDPETIRLSELPAADREVFAANGLADGDTIGVGTTLLYTDAVASERSRTESDDAESKVEWIGSYLVRYDGEVYWTTRVVSGEAFRAETAG